MTETNRQTVFLNRNTEIIRYNIIGVIMNLSLSAGKLITGFLFHSHAVMLDGINSLSDLVSEIFAILSVKIGAKSADPSHPFGYGRLEYVSSLLITMIILYVGVTSIADSVDSILHPHEPPEYTVFLIAVMCISLLAKLAYGLSMKRKGKEVGSAAMIMTGTESMGDSLIAVAVLVSCAIYKITGADVEHYLCILISLMIIRTGIEMVRDCMNKILGTRVDPDLKKDIIRTVVMEDGVRNVSGLVLHNYGEGVNVGSVDIEVEETTPASEINRITRNVKRSAKERGVILTSVGVHGMNYNSAETSQMWDTIIDLSAKHRSVHRAQSFSADPENRIIYFEIVENIAVKNRAEDLNALRAEVQAAFPDMRIEMDIVLL